MTWPDLTLFTVVINLSCALCPVLPEAIEAIIAYSQSAEELLKRKKVHRDVIFKYLATEKVVLPATSDKHQLVKRTLEFWSSDSKVHKLLILTHTRSYLTVYCYL